MELRFVSEKTLNGLSIRTDNATEMDPNKGKKVWRMCPSCYVHVLDIANTTIL